MRYLTSLILTTVVTVAAALGAGPVADAPPNNPDAIVDLCNKDSIDLVKGQWRYSDARIIEVDHRAPGPDNKPSGAPTRTHDISPKAGAADFDDSAWATLDPSTMEARRSTGRLAFNWYRLRLTIPENVGSFATAGSTAVLELVMDDYAEVWVDGKLPQVLGQRGGQLIAGWNAPNRVVLARDVRPGQQIQVAIFAANGPLSDPPPNFIWVRSATLDFYRPQRLTAITTLPVEIVRLDPAIDSLIPKDARLEKLASGFKFTEGPVWVDAKIGGAGAAPIAEGYLLFSDPNANTIYRWSESDGVSVYRTKSGYKGTDIAEYGQPGSNGLTLDKERRLTICEHGNRRVTRLEKNGSLTVLAAALDGKRLNSPNDLVYRSDGTLYFTDPPFGLPKFHDDPRRELPFTAVFCLYQGTLKVVSRDFTGPNGLAFSPDEKFLYVANWDTAKKVINRYEVQPDGSLTGATLFFDMGAPELAAHAAGGEEALDGLKVDTLGNIYASGPGGVWIISPAARHLGMIRGPQLPANFAFGESDGKTLYLCARTGLYRMRLNVAGIRP